MKPQFIILLLCIFGVLIAGGVEKSWYITVYDDFFTPSHVYPTWETYCLKTSGDTLMEDQSYQKLIKFDSLQDQGAYFGALRIDSNRVYSRDDNVNNWLVYDFNLEPGDTTWVFRFGGNFNSYHKFLTVIDSVSQIELNNSLLKQMHVKYVGLDESDDLPPGEDIWVEGIGSIKHGLFYISCFGFTGGCYKGSELTCYHENNSLIWHNPDYNKCWIDSVDTSVGIEKTINEGALSEAVVYQNSPNPFSDNAEIKYFIPAWGNSATFYIYNMQGRKVKNIPLKTRGEASVTIHGSELPAGMYIYSLHIDGQEVDSKRMVLTE